MQIKCAQYIENKKAIIKMNENDHRIMMTLEKIRF